MTWIDRLICRIFGHKPWAVDRDDCSRCGEELPMDDARWASWVRPAPPPRYKAQPMIPWWWGTHGPTPPGWVEPDAAVEVWSLWDTPATKSVTIPGKNWVITAEYQGKRR